MCFNCRKCACANTECKDNKEDVKKVAQALIDQCMGYDDYHHGDSCDYCGTMQLGTKHSHDKDCVCLIAQDILTSPKYQPLN